jgi:sugar diacid utilization regulator
MGVLPRIAAKLVVATQKMDSQPHRELARRLASLIYHEVRAQVSAYGAIADPAVRDDVRDVMYRVALLYCDAVLNDRLPDSADCEYLAGVGRRRAHDAIPLEAVLQSNRIGVHLLWTHLLELRPDLDEGQVAIRTLGFADVVNTPMTQGYMSERRILAESNEEALRLFVTRLVSAEAEQHDEEAMISDGRSLGLDLSVPNVAALVAQSRSQGHSDAETAVLLARIRPALQAMLPEAPLVATGHGLLAVLRVSSVTEAEHRMLSGVKSLLDPASLVVATGTPRTGGHGLATSYREAQRALALGALVDPAAAVYSYEELQVFDLFKEGEALDKFVTTILKPVLKERGTKRRELMKTLEVLFRTGQNRKQTARELRIHVNTLAYRIHRLEELLGESLTLGENSGDTSFRFQLALKLLPISRLADLD